MSGEEGRTVIAGEYVLGLLPPDRREALEREAALDPALMHEIDTWRRRLAPLDELGEAPPHPVLWQRIEASLDRPAPVVHYPVHPPTLRLPFWQALLRWRMPALAGAAGAALASLLLWPAPREAPPAAVATLLPHDGRGAPLRLTVSQTGIVEVHSPALRTDGGRRIDLWAKPANEAAPRLIGEIQDGGGTTPLTGLPLDATTIMLTADLRGPITAPGIILYEGVLTALDR